MAITEKQIKKWNETFKKASKPEKKVLIAKDILLNLKLKKYVANKGNYFRNKWDLGQAIGWDKDIQQNFNNIEKCECCALGACLISSTKYQNKLTLADLSDSSSGDSWKQLKSIFTPREMSIMENCFEGYDEDSMRVASDNFHYKLDEKTGIKCDDFYYNYKTDDERLKAICNNIIKNKGYIKI